MISNSMTDSSIHAAAVYRNNRRPGHRFLLLLILGYEGAGALLGGILLVADPDGHLMDMPVRILHGVFVDFLVPGIILLALGLLSSAAFVMVFRRKAAGPILAVAVLSAFVVWFSVEIAILRELHWLHFMWGLPVYLGFIGVIPMVAHGPDGVRKVLLLCGMLSSALYVVMTSAIPLLWPMYNSASQTISEISAVGAPTRPIWVWLGMLYTILVVAFGMGVVKSAGGRRALKAAGILLMVYGALGVLWPFAPMHLRETLAAGGGDVRDVMHIALGGFTELIYLLALGFAAAASGKAFRIYSAATFLVLMVFGILMSADASGIALNRPTPLLGVWERINIGIFLAWMVLLAAVLLRSESSDRSAAPA